jgi:hypothetical protein
MNLYYTDIEDAIRQVERLMMKIVDGPKQPWLMLSRIKDYLILRQTEEFEPIWRELRRDPDLPTDLGFVIPDEGVHRAAASRTSLRSDNRKLA